MARIRTIKPEFFRHEDLYEAERKCGLPLRLAFAGLWTACDREGRFAWKPRALKLDCLPFDEIDFAAVLNALVEHGFIKKFTHQGDAFGFIPSWSKHQIVNNREALSTIPAPDDDASQPAEPRVEHASGTRHGNSQGEGKGREGERNGKGKDTATPTAEPSSKPTPLDFRKELWARGPEFLKSNSGRSEADCRSLLGKWRKSHGDLAVLDALAAAEGAAASDAISYVERVLAGKVKANGNSQGQLGAGGHPLGFFGQLADEAREAAGASRFAADG